MNWLDPALAHLDAGTPAIWVVLATARGSSTRDGKLGSDPDFGKLEIGVRPRFSAGMKRAA